ncbi:MAG: lamin tail domain-containing protein [Verrucomicrobiales bacterium]
MYHPEPDGDAEFIELRNTSDSVTLDLGGAYFSAGVEFTFPGGTMLAPGERILVVRSVAAFEAAHGAGLRIAGEFANGSSLNNAGESVKLDDAGGSTIAEIDYDDRYPWPLPADEGYSLVYISGDPGAAANWRSSAARGGNPGSSDAMPYSGGSLIGYALASPAPWVESADFDFFRYTVNVAADAAAVIPEWSGDLGGWESDALTLVDQIAHGDGTSDMVWRLPRGTAGFVRLRISLRE